MKVKAIKPCPNNKPGDVFELPDELGKVFVGLGLAQEVPAAEAPTSASRPSRRQHQRRDLEAEK